MVNHGVTLHTPYYAGADDGTVLHRYLDDRFVVRFLDDANNGRLTGLAGQAWRSQDRFGRYSKDYPTLRLPLHQAFHMVCCELCCDLPGHPPLDPARVLSAGMVIRRGTPDSHARWLLRDDQPVGWRQVNDPDPEPDQHLRLAKRGLVKPRPIAPLYSGEQVHPMHTVVVRQSTTAGNARNRTLLYGFLPLGGAYHIPLEEQDRSGDTGETASIDGQLAEQRWPFGSLPATGDAAPASCSGGEKTLGELAADCCGQPWQQSTGYQVKGAVPTEALRDCLRTLVERYRLQEDNDANEALANLLAQVALYALPGQVRSKLQAADGDGDFNLAKHTPIGNLLDYIRNTHEALIDWYAERDYKLRMGETVVEALPAASKTADWDLYITEAQARTLRELLVLRVDRAAQDLTNALPIPRFAQGENDVYFVQPFVRYCHNGRQAIAWGPPSKPFRVTGPLDPEAARPVAIQLPELSDLKRGFARGVSFLTPKSLADKMAQIEPGLDFETKGKTNKLQACLGISISFSIPIITICAMILLMIILNLLNFFLRWLPWAFLKLPRLCK